MADQEVKVGIKLDISQAEQQLAKFKSEIKEIGNLRPSSSQSLSDMTHLFSLEKQISDIKRATTQVLSKGSQDAETAAKRRLATEREIHRLANQSIESSLGLIGGYRGRQGMRAISRLEDLSNVIGEDGNIIGLGGAFKAITSAAMEAAPVLGAMVIGIQAVSLAWNFATGVIKEGAMQMASAMAKIGAIRSLDQIIFETAEVENRAAQIANLNSSGTNKMQIFQMIQNISANSRFNPNMISESILDYARNGGNVDLLKQNVSTGAGTFGKGLSEIANVYNPQDPTAIFKGMGILLRSNPGMTGDQALGFAERALYLRSQTGTDFFQSPNMFTKLHNAPNMSKEMVFESLLAVGLGGPEGRLDINKLQKLERAGINYNNLSSNIVHATTPEMQDIKTWIQHKDSNVDVNNTRSIQNFIDNLNDGQNAAKFFSQALTVAKNTIEDQWRTAVNDVTVAIENALLPVLVSLTPEIKILADSIKNHAPEIATAANSLGHLLLTLAKDLPYLIAAILSAAEKLIDFIFPDAQIKGKIDEAILNSKIPGARSLISVERRQEMEREIAEGKLVAQLRLEAEKAIQNSNNPVISAPITRSAPDTGVQGHMKTAADSNLQILDFEKRQALVHNQLLQQIINNTRPAVPVPNRTNIGNK